ncbi:hypothetical protein J6O48_05940 [bacterium]|nr:hypothetical protein [bacterium]
MNNKLEDIFNKKKPTLTISLNSDDLRSDLETSMLLAKSFVPYSHRRIADNYVLLRRIFSFQIVQPRISKVEEAMLSRYYFDTLENTTISKANSEIAQLKEWATSTDDNLRTDSEELLKIRVKELKFMLSENYTHTSNEVLKGYQAIETYLTSVTKYYK